MQLVHLTDLHFGCEDKAALHAAKKYIAETKPDAVIVTGDISKDGLESELMAAGDWMRGLEAPVMLTPGNHDVPYYEMLGRLLYPWDRFERAAVGIQTEAWHTPLWSIVPINTARAWQFRFNWAQGEISRGQTAIAGAELQRAQEGALRIVITHHPLDWPNDAPIKGLTRGGLRGLEKLIDSGAELFLSGHLHFASARLVGTRALSVTSGTLSQRVRHEPCAFSVIRRPEPQVIETEVIHIVQGVCQSASTRRFTLAGLPHLDQPAEIHAQV
ncbi:metallophosphoesterase family protein [Vitreimonas flagellata]|uniref:metallophosphoesterase family protein n=1 Tax=Vitreimonas flagellata TaxID=2560861 RepID=UPI0010752777|nr:metallophosphoesterase [Vitreimonas flagellata]